MRKLRLTLDDLEVHSFTTAEAEDIRGTVEAHVSAQCTGGLRTCDNGATCVYGETCGGWETCRTTCHYVYSDTGGGADTVVVSCPPWQTCTCDPTRHYDSCWG